MGEDDVTIVLERPTAIAGQLLEGSICFFLKSETSCDGVQLRFTGNERILVRQSAGETTSDITAKHRLVDQSVPLDVSALIVQGKIAAGEHTVPFKVDLPAHLPASMKVTGNNDSYCQVLYELKAELSGSGVFRNYKTSKVVRVRSLGGLSPDPLPYTTNPPVTDKLYSCGFIPRRGDIAVAAHVPDTTLEVGRGRATVAVACRNKSTASIHSVTARLVEKTHWNANGPDEWQRTILQESEFPGLDGLVSANTTDEDLMRQVAEATNKVDLIVPNGCLNTYDGKLIKVTHAVEIEFRTNQLTSNPILSIPVDCGDCE